MNNSYYNKKYDREDNFHQVQSIVSMFPLETQQDRRDRPHDKPYDKYHRYRKPRTNFSDEERTSIMHRVSIVGAERAAEEAGTTTKVIMSWLKRIDEDISQLNSEWEEGISKEWAEAITDIAVRNITPPEVHISGYVDIESFAPNGVDVIIKALKAAEKHDDEDEINVQCVGAPRYRITVKSTDYLNAEKALKAAAERCIEVVEASDGNGSFLRELED